MRIQKIHLVRGSLDVSSHGVAFQATGSTVRVALPPEAGSMVEEMLAQPGITLRELVRRLHARGERVAFRALSTTLERLAAAGALRDDAGAKLAPSSTTQTLAQWILGRFVGRVRLFGRVDAGRGASIAFAVVAVALVAFATFAASGGALRLTRRFLFLGGTSALGLVVAVVAFSAFRTLRNLVKGALLLLARGNVPGGSLVVTPVAVYFEVADADFYATSSPWQAFLYGAASVATLPCVAAVASRFLRPDVAEQIGMLALVFTLWELRPYGDGELRRVARAFVGGDLDGAELPYLKTRALGAALTSRRPSPGEGRLLVYASLALLWTIVSLDVALRLVNDNAAHFHRVLRQAQGANLVALLVVLAILATLVGLLLLDLAGTFVQNLASPLEARGQRALRSLRSRDDGTVDPAVVRAAITAVPLFRECPAEAVDQLAARGTVRSYRAGAPIIVQGDVGRELYVLVDGAVRVARRDVYGRLVPVARLRGRCVFGELAVLKDAPRTANVTADTDVTLLVLQGDAFKAVTSDPAYARDFEGCLDRIVLQQYFASSPAFQAVPSEVLSTLLEQGEFVELAEGAELFAQGAAGDAFYLVLRGEVDVVIDGAVATQVGQGSFVGEMALLSAQPRAATVRARIPTKLLRVGAEGFWEIVSGNLALATFLEAAAEERTSRLRTSTSAPAGVSP